MFSGKTIFVAPLDWGLGHATRCVPIIRELEKHNKVLIGVTPLIKPVFDEELPQLEQIALPSYKVRYSRLLPLWLKLALDWPRLRAVIRTEHALLAQIIRDHGIEVVISDNRFGLFSEQAHTVFITHQVFLKTPFAAGLAQRVNSGYIRRFKELWIPDYEREGESLAGTLSHGRHFHPQVRYIGPQTRLTKTTASQKKYDYLLLLSGPEPHHTLLRKTLADVAAQHPSLSFALVSNAPPETWCVNIETVISPNGRQLSELIAASNTIVCRSGYSTLMDLHVLDKRNMILIPTPGQTEQEYLAQHWKEKFSATILDAPQRWLP